MDASVVIPTKNGGARFEDVVDMVAGQVTSYSFEVVCVDSGSTDGTLAAIRSRQWVRLLEIDPADFGHGKTRSWAAGRCRGDYVVFITQDALPADEFWLQHFIDAMKIDPEVVGGFGIHYPYPDCNVVDARNIRAHFEQFGDEDVVIQVPDLERFERDLGYRMGFAFFSDNNACVRRDFFCAHPYPDVNFAEDQAWMMRMMGEGRKKVYCPHAAVYHSHNFGVLETARRSFDENRALKRLFDWSLVPDGRKIPAMTWQSASYDCAYIRTLDLPAPKKARAAAGNFARTAARFFGAHEGAVYDECSPARQRRMDALLSQFARQVKG